MILHVVIAYGLLSAIATAGLLLWGRAHARRMADQDRASPWMSRRDSGLDRRRRTFGALGRGFPET